MPFSSAVAEAEIVISVLQSGKLRRSEDKGLAESHEHAEWQSYTSAPGLLASSTMYDMTPITKSAWLAKIQCPHTV